MIYQILIFILLLGFGYLFGMLAEKRHYKSIFKRELQLNQLPAIASRYPPDDQAYEQHLVTGSVVVASDYFKSFLASLINLFGGSIISYETLLDRARREAILRMKEQAKELKSASIFNIKYVTATIGNGRTGSIEVLAYGTAMVPTNTPSNVSVHA